MTAEVVSVGTELLLGQIVDTHAATIAKVLAECGLVCQRRSTVGDNLDRIVAALREALERADVVVTIGGLGPTQDDLTRDAIAIALGDRLEPVPAMQEELRNFFASRNLRWTDSILRQADKPSCSRFIPNPHGTAPGLIAEKGGKTIVAMPGPTGEFVPMATGPVKDYLSGLTGEVIHSVLVRVAGMGESHVEDLIQHMLANVNPTVAPYAHPGEVHLRVTARAKDQETAAQLIEPVVNELRSILGEHLFALDQMSLEEALLGLMLERGLTVSVSESMTGGELSARLTSSPGASAAFRGGVVCYTADAKSILAGASEEVVRVHGTVSAETAAELAQGVRTLLNTDFGLSIVGNAGPGVDSADGTVGEVHLGLATAGGVKVRSEQYRGSRPALRKRATQAALTWLRDEILSNGQERLD